MGDTMHSRPNDVFRSRVVVQGILSASILAAGLFHSVKSQALEPWQIPAETIDYDEENPEDVIEGGIAATMLFSTLGLGAGIVAATIDAESERKRDDPCRTCSGGFNDMQRDMAMVGNVALFSFLAAGIVGTATTIYAIAVEDEINKSTKSIAALQIRGNTLGIKVTF